MGRISPRYVTDITAPDPLSLMEVGGGGSNSEKLEKTRYLQLTNG